MEQERMKGGVSREYAPCRSKRTADVNLIAARLS